MTATGSSLTTALQQSCAWERSIYEKAQVDGALKAGLRSPGILQQVFILSGPKEPQTKILPAPLKHSQQATDGRRIAFTQGQR